VISPLDATVVLLQVAFVSLVHEVESDTKCSFAFPNSVLGAEPEKLAVLDGVTWKTVAEPGSPFSPFGPIGPSLPLGPSGPVLPVGPVGPSGPVAPFTPSAPFGPSGP
jgi:hypothetical protein